MPDFEIAIFGVTPQSAEEALGRVAMLGNAGNKIGRVIDAVFSPNVEDPTVPKPVEKKVVEILGFAPVVELKALADFVVSGGKKTGGGADLPRGVDVTGRAIEDAPAVGGNQPAVLVQMMPMWNTDP